MRRLLPLLMIVAVISGATIALRSQNIPTVTSAVLDERTDGSHITIVDEAGAVLHMTGHVLEPGDEWITDDNRRFQIARVEGDIAFAQFMGPYSLSAEAPEEAAGLLERLFSSRSREAQASHPQVAIYHTHSDESYVPSDGTSSKQGRGGIYDVGRALRDSLTQKGVRVVQDLATHLPHDSSAYQRSRRTAANLLKSRPAALFDVHRDAAPAQAYAGTVSGEDVTRVTLVIGKANPKYKANAALANALKAEVDKTSPGLIKGILFRNGGYNQDLYSRMALLEVGAHTNQKDDAEKAMGFISAGVAKVAGAAAGAGGTPTSTDGGGNWSALGWIVGLTILGVVVYMFVSTGSFKEAWSKLRRFGREDLAGFLGWSGSGRAKSKDRDKTKE